MPVRLPLTLDSYKYLLGDEQKQPYFLVSEQL